MKKKKLLQFQKTRKSALIYKTTIKLLLSRICAYIYIYIYIYIHIYSSIFFEADFTFPIVIKGTSLSSVGIFKKLLISIHV